MTIIKRNYKRCLLSSKIYNKFINYLLEETIKYTNISKDKIFIFKSIKKMNMKSKLK